MSTNSIVAGAKINFGTCPVCEKKNRRPDCAVCKLCREEYEKQANAPGQVPIMNVFDFALFKALEALSRLRNEFALAEGQWNECWSKAECGVMKQLRTSGLASIGLDELDEKIRQKMIELIGQKEFSRLEFIGRVHSKKIESLSNFIISMERKQAEFQEKQQSRATVSEEATVAAV